MSEPTADIGAKLARILELDGVHEALRLLNSRAPHRFTGVYRFDGDTLRNLHLVDVYTPQVQRGDDVPMAETYCSLVHADEAPVAFIDARSEERLAAHPARESVISYCGVLLRGAAGRPFGTLCHFDMMPCDVPHNELPLMEEAGRLLMRVLEP